MSESKMDLIVEMELDRLFEACTRCTHQDNCDDGDCINELLPHRKKESDE